MAGVFTFDKKQAMRDQDYAKKPATINKIQQALAAKHVPAAQIGRFVTAVTAYNFSPITSEANRYIMKNLKGKGLFTSMSPNVAEEAMMVALFGPQTLILKFKFDLSVHLKNGNVELYYTDCKGKLAVLISTA